MFIIDFKQPLSIIIFLVFLEVYLEMYLLIKILVFTYTCYSILSL